jgi:hypothetical protein
MNNLRKLSAAVILTLALGFSAFAGIMEGPPCAPPDPGIMEGPPCAGGQIAPDPATSGQVQTSPASVAADASSFAISLLESLLPIF